MRAHACPLLELLCQCLLRLTETLTADVQFNDIETCKDKIDKCKPTKIPDISVGVNVLH